MTSGPGGTSRQTLESLPPEIRGLIAGRVVDVKDRRSLAKTSRTMRDSTDPYVFQRIVLSDSTEEMGKSEPIKLLRSLLEQPHLRKYVRFLESSYIEEHFDCDINNIRPEDRQTIREARQTCRSGYQQSDDPEYKQHHFEAALALLLQLCSNLKEIHLGMTQATCDCRRPELEEIDMPTCASVASSPQDDLHRQNANHTSLLSHPREVFDVFRRIGVVKSPDGGDSLFSKLTRVVLDVHPEQTHCYRGNIAGASSLFRLPSLAWLTVKGATFKLRMDIGKDEIWDCPENGSNIQRLELDQCEMDTTTLCRMLKSCKGLREVRIDLMNGDTGEGQFPWSRFVDWAMVSSALQNSRDTLETLSISVGTYGGSPNDPEAPNDSPIGSLKAFKKLKCLDLDEYVILGRTDGGAVEVDYSEGSQGDFQIMARLPPNLECFHLESRIGSDCMAAVLKQLARGLFAKRRTLQFVNFFSADYDGASNNELLESLRVACPSIKFRVVEEPNGESERHFDLELSHKQVWQNEHGQLLIEDVPNRA